MKKKIALLVCAFTLAYTAGNAANNSGNAVNANAFKNSNANTFINPFANARLVSYVWFTDIDLTNLTGSVCDMATEINRLVRTYPGFVFSPYFYGGLHAFEFGYYPFFNIAIIYSDLNYV